MSFSKVFHYCIGLLSSVFWLFTENSDLVASWFEGYCVWLSMFFWEEWQYLTFWKAYCKSGKEFLKWYIWLYMYWLYMAVYVYVLAVYGHIWLYWCIWLYSIQVKLILSFKFQISKTVWRFLRKLNIELPYDPPVPVLNSYLKEMKILEICTSMFFCSIIYNSHDMVA